MPRLRHPIRSFKEPFGKAGLTVAILALVLAMVGGAYAASGALSGKQKKEVEKIAKKDAGKPGANGAAGTAGTNGTNGTNGKDGAAGTAGTNGTNGKTVRHGTTNPTNAIGTEGDFYINTTTDEIFGPKPTTAGAWGSGTELKGEPGVIHPGETLPSEASETGTWSLGRIKGSSVPPGYPFQGIAVPVSFPVPLPSELDAAHVHVIAPNGKEVDEGTFEATVEPTDCGSGIEPGVGVEHPEANPGHLCIYMQSVNPALPSTFFGNSTVRKPDNTASGASVAGALLSLSVNQAAAETSGYAEASGTWAVTAP